MIVTTTDDKRPSKSKKDHGNTGNHHARIGEKAAETSIMVRVPVATKSDYTEKSKNAGLTLSAWVRQTLDTAQK